MYNENYRMICKSMKRVTAFFIVCHVLIYNCILPLSVVAQQQNSMTDIRIGLKSNYVNVGIIKISNTSIGIGYCIDGRYICDTELTSTTGFTFQSAKGYYYSLEKIYQTYATAKMVADTLQGLQVNAYPVCIYRNYWKVYIGGTTDKSEMSIVYERIKERFGYTYSSLLEDNGQRVLVTGSGITFLVDGDKKGAYPQIKALAANQSGDYVLDLGSRQYRGRIEIGRYGKENISAVNVINIETYLYGVVPSEMISSWPAEALKAQAVCARSFALSKTGYSADSNLSRAYYIDDTTSSQVYKGYGAETGSTTRAVEATRGEVVTYNNKLIPAYFFSTSGGRTENGSDVWGQEYPYLKSVVDRYEMEPEKDAWLITYTAKELASKLNANNLGIGGVKDMIPQLTTSSGRVYLLKIFGTESNAVLQSNTIRSILDLYSTKFKIVKYDDIPDEVSVISASGTSQLRIIDSYIISDNYKVKKADDSLEQFIVKGSGNTMNYPASAPNMRDTYYIAGLGYGHGVGMSQSGAKGMALASYTYKEIVEYYFTNCKVSNIN